VSSSLVSLLKPEQTVGSGKKQETQDKKEEKKMNQSIQGMQALAEKQISQPIKIKNFPHLPTFGGSTQRLGRRNEGPVSSKIYHSDQS